MLGIDQHGPEFPDLEDLAVFAQAFLGKKNGAAQLPVGHQHAKNEQGRSEDQAPHGQDEINNSF